MENFPADVVNKIYSYLPVLDERRKKLNQSIKSVGAMNLIIKQYVTFFTEDEIEDDPEYTDDILLEYAIGWCYNDLTCFMNNEVPLGQHMVPSYCEFMSRVSRRGIKSYRDLLRFELTFRTNLPLIRLCASEMTMSEISEFWSFTASIYDFENFTSGRGYGVIPLF